MNWLFWHSSDVFIQAHIETIYTTRIPVIHDGTI